MTRLLVSPDHVRTDGLVGILYVPEGTDRLSGVIMLGGAEGGLHEDDAALLAAHGCATLALAYYGLPGLPDTLREVPLEYFGTALRFLAENVGFGCEDPGAGRTAD
jgi:hypothetical protein